MKDLLLEIGKNPSARRIIKTLGLPIPLPEPLRREPGAMPARPLQDRKIIAGGAGELVPVIAETLASAGAEAYVADSARNVFTARGKAEAFNRPAWSVNDLGDARADGVVFDASAVASAADLRAVFDFFQPLVGRISRSGRVLVLARPAAGLSPEAAAAQAALDGFVRSVAKEIGRIGATANLILIEKGAERRAAPVLRFALSAKSAFITAQPIPITGRARGGDEPALVRGLDKKIALVTGAARGIGAATARALAAEGAHVICLDRPADEAATLEVAREIGGSALLVDLTDPGAASIIADAARARGGVDVMVHNAGITRDKTLARMSPEQWDQVLQVNLEAVIRVHQATEPHLRDGGRVICLSSIAGLAGNVGQTAYAASKAGIAGFVAVAAGPLAARGITVNAVAPGFIETRLTAAIPFAIREVARRLAALGQGGLPEDVADAIAFLATPGSQGITGTTLRVCGGAFVGR
jgi:3-oxoacyl-[acyl-carrier protein] reductase